MTIRIHIPDVEQILADLLDEDRISAATPPDPFLIDHDCINPAGHYPVRMHGEIVCPHCSKVIWQ